jgi:hypothetical protein
VMKATFPSSLPIGLVPLSEWTGQMPSRFASSSR